MADSWDTTASGATYTIGPPQAGKYWLKTVTVGVSSAPSGHYWRDHDPKEGGFDYGGGHAYVTVSGGGQSVTAYATTTGYITDGTFSDGTKFTTGHATGSVTVNFNKIMTPSMGAVTVQVAGGWVGNSSPGPFWDWAFANFTFSYVDGHTSSHTDCQYGTTVSDSHVVGHYTNYIGNGGTPATQTRNQSYTCSGSLTVNADHCAQYPSYINISVGGQTKTFVRQGDGIVLPTLEDYLFEGWWGVQNSRSGRGDEWLDGKSLGTHGTYTCYAHYMTSPIHEFKDGAWHRWLPPDMNAQSVNGTKTVNNIRSKHSDGTWPLDKPIYERQNGEWVQRKGPMIPPEGS